MGRRGRIVGRDVREVQRLVRWAIPLETEKRTGYFPSVKKLRQDRDRNGSVPFDEKLRGWSELIGKENGKPKESRVQS